MDSFSSDFGFGSQSFSQAPLGGGFSSSSPPSSSVGQRRSSIGNSQESSSSEASQFGRRTSVSSSGGGGRSRGGKGAGSEGCVPSTVSLIHLCFLQKKEAEERRGGGGGHENIQLHGKNVGAVTLCGWVEEPEVLLSQIKFKLCDGSGRVDVFFDLSSSTSSEEEDTWRSSKTEIIKAGRLVRVVGTAVASSSGGKREVGEDKLRLCTIEACHFRAVADFREYAYFADVEVAFAALQMTGGEGKAGEEEGETEKEEERINNHSVKGEKEESTMTVKRGKSEFRQVKGEEDWEAVDLPDVFDHISDERHQAVLKVLYSNTQKSSGGGCEENLLSAQDVFTSLKNEYRVPELMKAVDALLEGGEIYQESGDRLALAF